MNYQNTSFQHPSIATPGNNNGYYNNSYVPDTADAIAVGLELKFLVAVLHTSQTDPEPERHPSALRTHLMGDDATAVAKTIADYVYGDIACKLQTYARQGAVSIGSIKANKREEKDFWGSHWIVKKANSAEPGPEETKHGQYIWVPVELSSVRLAGWQKGEAGGGGAFDGVRTVLQTIGSHYRAVANYTCDVHVHLGRLDEQQYGLDTMKRLAVLCWLAEPVMRLVRDPASPNAKHVYTWGSPLRTCSRLAKVLTRDMAGDLAGDLARDGPVARIYLVPDHRALGLLLSGPTPQYRRLGFNFSAFGGEDERARRNPRTVEVRFLEGTLRADVVVGWLEICVRLVVVVMEAAAMQTPMQMQMQTQTQTQTQMQMQTMKSRSRSKSKPSKSSSWTGNNNEMGTWRFDHLVSFLSAETCQGDKGWTGDDNGKQASDAFRGLMEGLGVGKAAFEPVRAMVKQNVGKMDCKTHRQGRNKVK